METESTPDGGETGFIKKSNNPTLRGEAPLQGAQRPELRFLQEYGDLGTGAKALVSHNPQKHRTASV